MIFAIEGPDKSGKTTVFEQLRKHRPQLGRYVPALPLDPALLPVMHLVEQRQAHVWEALYDPKTTYICDRHFAVSGKVYDVFFGRPMQTAISAWDRRICILYLNVSLGTLHSRHANNPDEYISIDRVALLRDAYNSVLSHCREVISIDGNCTVEAIADAIAQIIRSHKCYQ